MAQAKKIINFMGQRFIAAAISALLIIASIGSLAVNGLQFGLDFTGGTQLEFGFEQPVDLNKVREVLDQQSLKNPSVVFFGPETDILIRIQGSLNEIAVQQVESSLLAAFGNEHPVTQARVGINSDQYAAKLIIEGMASLDGKTQDVFPLDKFGEVTTQAGEGGTLEVMLKNNLDEVISASVLNALQTELGQNAELRRSEFVGPHIGEELRDDGGLGLLFALAVVMVYVALRFQYKFSVGAVAALAHDVVLVLGFFSVFKMDFDLTVLAAVLAVIGYSLNDTIVVSDRIRENFRKVRKGTSEEVINISLSQTLGRTLVTSLTTLLVLVALFVFGGELIHGFATALIVGVSVGTYSSIYVAANVLLSMNISKEDLMMPEKEGAEMDELP